MDSGDDHKPGPTQDDTPVDPPMEASMEADSETKDHATTETNETEPVVREKPTTARELSSRNVIVAGKNGAGKETLIEHVIRGISGNDPSSAVQDTNHWQVKTKTGIMLSMFKVDTPYDDVAKLKDTAEAKKKYKKKLKRWDDNLADINLIMLVIRHGHFTREEKEIFEVITSSLTKDVLERCVLILTGCEELSEEKRKEVKELYATDRDTKAIVDRVKNSTEAAERFFCVGFPNLDVVLPSLREIYQPGIEKDQNTLIELIEGNKNFVLRESIFASPSLREKFAICKCGVM